jgi:RNA polymerase-associated protein
MAVNPNRRSNMTLYCTAADPHGHRVRIVLAEKGVIFDRLDIEKSIKLKEELLEINPYGSTPTLVDRDLILYQSEIIMEYLDERFPHPPLMPVYPVARARSRLMLYRINQDWYSAMDTILRGLAEGLPANAKEFQGPRQVLKEGLLSIAPIFSEMPYFLSEEFSLVDCCMAPLLWRLPLLGIGLPPEAQSVLTYAERLFERESFTSSLTEAEKAMKNMRSLS